MPPPSSPSKKRSSRAGWKRRDTLRARFAICTLNQSTRSSGLALSGASPMLSRRRCRNWIRSRSSRRQQSVNFLRLVSRGRSKFRRCRPGRRSSFEVSHDVFRHVRISIPQFKATARLSEFLETRFLAVIRSPTPVPAGPPLGDHRLPNTCGHHFCWAFVGAHFESDRE